MERTIKNFNKFTKDLWEEFAMNFLNSIVPNPFEVLGNLDDISLEYEDMGYLFFPALEIINLRDDWSVDILYSELTAQKYKEPSEKIIKYCQLFFLISFVSGNSNESYQLYDHPFPKKGYFADNTLESRIGTLIITTKLK